MFQCLESILGVVRPWHGALGLQALERVKILLPVRRLLSLQGLVLLCSIPASKAEGNYVVHLPVCAEARAGLLTRVVGSLADCWRVRVRGGGRAC